MGGQTSQWLLLAVLSAALCTGTPIMADPGHFEPEPAEVSAHHKRTAWPDVQEGEAGPSGRRRRRKESPGQTKSPTRSPTKYSAGSPTKSPTRSPTKYSAGSPTKSPSRSPCDDEQEPNDRPHSTPQGITLNCNQNYGGGSWPCGAEFYDCRGFVQGSGWGRCWKPCVLPPSTWTTKSPTQDPCAAFKPAPPTCPNGYSVTAGSLVDKQTKEHGVCIMIQSVLCQCGSSGSGCPKAECKQFKPVVNGGVFNGFEVSADTLFVSNFTGWTATQPTAQNMPKVIRIMEREYENAIQTRAQKIDACATESIQAAQTRAATTTTLLTEPCYKNKNPDLQCCKAPSPSLFSIPGSHQWEDTPTRCTLENPLVQSFYSNVGVMTVALGRNEMARKPEEVTELKQHVHASLVAAFPGKLLALHVDGAAGSFWIVIGVGQRATTSRRLLGGGSFTDNANLDGKAPGSHECEVKYMAVVSTMKNASMPQCVKNIKGGELCEPEIAASLTPWMHTKEEHEKQHLMYSKKLFRPNNNIQTCAHVDTALRKGLAAYRFGLKVRLAEKLSLGEGI